jgi:hypothetical protein
MRFRRGKPDQCTDCSLCKQGDRRPAEPNGGAGGRNPAVEIPTAEGAEVMFPYLSVYLAIMQCVCSGSPDFGSW